MSPAVFLLYTIGISSTGFLFGACYEHLRASSLDRTDA